MGRRAQGWKLVSRRGIYSVRFLYRGKRVERSTGERDPHKAATKAAEIYARVVQGRPARGNPNVLSGKALDVLFAEWLAETGPERDELTNAQYEGYAAAHFVPFFRRLSNVTTERATEYWRKRLRSVQRPTVMKELSALRGFLRWAEGRGHLTKAPTVESPPRNARGTIRYDRETVELTEDQVVAILSHLPERTRRGNPARAFYTVMWETGLRRGSLCALQAPQDYAKGRDSLTLRPEADKARYGRVLPLTKGAREALDSVCPDVGRIFEDVDYRHTLRKAAKDAGLPEHEVSKLTDHDFRHARTTLACERSGNLVGVAYLVGHKQITTTNQYVHPRRSAAEDVLRAIAGEPSERDSGDSSGDVPPKEENPAKAGSPGSVNDDGSLRKRGLEPPRVLPHRNLNALAIALEAKETGISQGPCSPSGATHPHDTGDVPNVTWEVDRRLEAAQDRWRATRDRDELRRFLLELVMLIS